MKPQVAAEVFSGVVLGSVVILAVVLLAYLCWHTFHPSGAIALNDAHRDAMDAAYDNGQYSEYVRLYETPVVVRYGPDSDYRERMIDDDDLFKIADSYMETGNTTAARERLLMILGWNAVDYNAYCLLTGIDCDDLHALRLLADAKRSEAH